MGKAPTIILILTLTAVAGAGVLVAARRGWLQPPQTQQQSEAKPGADGVCRHTLPTAECPFCTPSLVESLGFCGGHGVPEAYCTRCSPKFIPAFKVENDWCAGHNLPESQCLLCNPELAKPGGSPPTSADGDASPGSETSASAQLHSQREPSVTCTKTNTPVTFKNAEVATQAGLATEVVQRRPMTKVLKCNAELAFNGDRLGHVSPRAPGVIERVKVQLGAIVTAGQPLAIINSAELGDAKAEYLQSMALKNLWKANFERQHSLAESGVIPQREFQETQTKLSESTISVSRAEQRMRNLGLNDQQVETVLKENETASLLAIVAPFDGVVVERHAVAGDVVDIEHVLFSIADVSTMWAMLDLNEADAAGVAEGQSVTVTLSGMQRETWGGTLTWISPQIDPHTRTLKARADIENPDGRLKANMFGRASIAIADQQNVLVVPKEAVQWEGCCNVVFVKRSETEFQPQKVRLGYEVDNWIAVEEGLEPNETIVTSGSFLLKTEILKGSIGAGCCEAHPAKK